MSAGWLSNKVAYFRTAAAARLASDGAKPFAIKVLALVPGSRKLGASATNALEISEAFGT